MIENILLILLILILSAKIIGSLFEKIGLDSSVGELLVGLVLGPGILNLIKPESIEYFAIIGAVLILFVVGLKQEEVTEIYRDKKAFALGTLVLFVTAAAMTVLFYYVPQYFEFNFSLLQALILGFAFAIIDVGVPARILVSKGLITEPVGKIIVRSAIVSIIIGLLLFSIVSPFANWSVADFTWKLIHVIVFIVLTIAIFYFFSKITFFVAKLHVYEAEFSLAVILVLALAYMTEVIGFSSLLGAFIAGILITRMPFARSPAFSEKINAISMGLFIPLFFVWFGLTINIKDILSKIWLPLIIFAAYIIIRFSVAYIYLKKNKFKAPLLSSASLLSVDVESLVVLVVAIQIGIFSDNTPLLLFAPSVFLSTFLIVILVAVFSKLENVKTISAYQTPAQTADSTKVRQKINK